MVGSTVSKAAERSGTVPESDSRSESFTVVAELLKEAWKRTKGLCERGRSRCYGWSGRQTRKDKRGCYLTGGC